MKNVRIILSIMLVILLCTAMLSGCNFDIFAPGQNQEPSNPTTNDPTNPDNPTNPNHGNDDPTNPNDSVDNAPTGSDDSNDSENPTNPEDDSSIMDGDDHLEFPFG